MNANVTCFIYDNNENEKGKKKTKKKKTIPDPHTYVKNIELVICFT